MNEDALCWIEQTIIPARDATVSVFDHGLLYGDGVFEGLRFYDRRTFMLEAHLQRLQRSAASQHQRGGQPQDRQQKARPDYRCQPSSLSSVRAT